MEIEEDNDKTDGPDFNKIGLFKEMSYLEGIPHFEFSDSSKGKQMVVECTKSKTSTQDGYFEKKFPRVFEGEAYADPIRARRLYRLAQAQLNLHHDEFKYTSPMKKPCGKGTNYGTFVEYDKKMEYFSTRPRDAGIMSPPKRNIFTNPPKKGTGYGYPDVTINKFPPYFLEEQLEELEETLGELPPRPLPRPFKPYKAGLFQQEFFDPNPYGSTLEQEEEEEEESKSKGVPKYQDQKEIKPFVVPGPAKKDGGMKDGCLSKFPEYTEDLYPTYRDDMRGAKHYVNKKNKMYRPAVPGLKPYPIKSIIAKNVEMKVTPQNCNKIKGVMFCKPSKKSELCKSNKIV